MWKRERERETDLHFTWQSCCAQLHIGKLQSVDKRGVLITRLGFGGATLSPALTSGICVTDTNWRRKCTQALERRYKLRDIKYQNISSSLSLRTQRHWQKWHILDTLWYNTDTSLTLILRNIKAYAWNHKTLICNLSLTTETTEE